MCRSADQLVAQNLLSTSRNGTVSSFRVYLKLKLDGQPPDDHLSVLARF